MDVETRININRMCEIILGNNFGDNELDSIALIVGHERDIINPDRKTVNNNRSVQLLCPECNEPDLLHYLMEDYYECRCCGHEWKK